MTRGKLFAGLLAATAVCAVLMYVSSDADQSAEEMIKIDGSGGAYRSALKWGWSANYKKGMPPSAASIDVVKTSTMFTATPGGAARLLDYLRSIETNLEAERMRERMSMQTIRAKLERNMRLAAAERKKMLILFNKKIAANAKRASQALWNAMRRTQAQFAATAKAANNRYSRYNRRMNAEARAIARNRRQARRDLQAAVRAQQAALQGMAQSMNSKITRTNKSITANAVQMRANAKFARKALGKAINSFNRKLAHVRSQAAKGRSRLAAQMATQNKKLRQWASSKILGVVAQTSSQFRRTRAKMAKNRAKVSRDVHRASYKFAKQLARNRAIANRNNKYSARKLAHYRKTAAKNIARVTSQFKTSISLMHATIKRQESEQLMVLNGVAGSAARNKAIQARVNRRLNAEMRRVVALGNSRERKGKKAHSKLNAHERRTKRSDWNKILRTRRSMQSKLHKMDHQLKRDRRNASKKLARATAGLYTKLRANERAQKSTNRRLAGATVAMRSQVASELRAAKAGFSRALVGMAHKIAKNERKADKQYRRLTGVVARQAVKERRGREMLEKQRRRSHNDLKRALSSAVARGQRRDARIAARASKMNKQTQAVVNLRLAAEVSRLKSQNQRAIDQFRMQNKRARAILKSSLMASLNQVRRESARNTRAAINRGMAKLASREAAARRAAQRSARARASLAMTIRRERLRASRRLRSAMLYQWRAQMSFQLATSKKLKSTNKRISAEAYSMAKSIRKANAKMQAQAVAFSAKARRSNGSIAAVIRRTNRSDMRRMLNAKVFMANQIARQAASVKKRFANFYGAMARERARQDKKLAGSAADFNSKLAKSIALTDARFRKTVKQIGAARRAAKHQLNAAKREFKTRLISLTQSVKTMETHVRGELSVVSAQSVRNREMMASVNRKTNKELARIVNISNQRWTAAKRARGRVRSLMNANKKLAARMVAAQTRRTKRGLARLSRRVAQYTINQRRALTRATAGLCRQLAKDKAAAAAGLRKTRVAAQVAKLQTTAALAGSKRAFALRLNNLANAVSANARSHSRALRRLTGVVRRNAAAGAADRARIRAQNKVMARDLNRKVVRAIQLGEARLRRSARKTAKMLKKSSASIRASISSKIQTMSDNVFNLIQGNQQRLADNYLSAKAYCVAAQYKLRNYNRRSKLNPLLSIGDWCLTVAGLSKVRPPKSPGLGMGLKTIPALFSSKKIKVKGHVVGKINGLVAEYMRTIKQVRARWGLGIGKYLLTKLEGAMLAKGILQVSTVGKKSSVFINGAKLGLSNRLDDFQSLAVGMPTYSATLSSLTKVLATLATHNKATRKLRVKAPEWQGN